LIIPILEIENTNFNENCNSENENIVFLDLEQTIQNQESKISNNLYFGNNQLKFESIEHKSNQR